jgi:hypothetical protein
VQTGFGPASTKSTPGRERLTQDQRDRGFADLLPVDDSTPDPDVLLRFQALRGALDTTN